MPLIHQDHVHAVGGWFAAPLDNLGQAANDPFSRSQKSTSKPLGLKSSGILTVRIARCLLHDPPEIGRQSPSLALQERFVLVTR